MAFFASVMLQIAVELAMEDDAHYEAMALKYFEHFLWIASAMDNPSHTGIKLWDHYDGIYYDVLRFPDGNGVPLKVRSLVGLLPLAATTVLPANLRERLPRFFDEAQWFLERHPHTAAVLTVPLNVGAGGSRILSLVNPDKLRRILGYMLDETEFLSPYGIRSLSRYHADHPYVFSAGGQEYAVRYVPGDSDTGMFGGNSNWRGPIWMPMQLMLIRALVNQYAHLGNDFTVECPVGSGRQLKSARSSLAGCHGCSSATRADIDLLTAVTADGTMSTGATTCCSTSTSMRTQEPVSAPAIRPAGPASSPS
jgi:hypothetical protein